MAIFLFRKFIIFNHTIKIYSILALISNSVMWSIIFFNQSLFETNLTKNPTSNNNKCIVILQN